MKKIISLALALAPVLAAAGPSLSPNLVQNGSFEANSLTAGQWTTYKSLSGWTVGANQIELRNNSAGSAFDGKNFAELDVYSNSSISQAIATIAGQWYELSFSFANRADSNKGAASNGIEWSFAGHNGVVGNSTVTKWDTFSTRFQGTGKIETLSFAARGVSDGYGTSLDKVALNAVPEPSSLALLAGGLLAMGLIKRRKNQG
ncbi:DUF642 domain-containing protein [Paucibacter sp. Y2R2-4]|uniref:DUF642 domain-containing protein n=1 Tax=Paucibacter sp. Y2R2-4 TaxID=2893553 RepID=UPI0021E4D4EE|nr:DUF642 domain-containing protein [Paucibacter sp. Y2R2-4]MCV2349426.1 DUF642 domain-containing protein [Paucibacter sp. Y2R2-4]